MEKWANSAAQVRLSDQRKTQLGSFWAFRRARSGQFITGLYIGPVLIGPFRFCLTKSDGVGCSYGMLVLTQRKERYVAKKKYNHGVFFQNKED